MSNPTPFNQEFVYNHPRSIYAKVIMRCKDANVKDGQKCDCYLIEVTRDSHICKKGTLLTPDVEEIDETAILLEI